MVQVIENGHQFWVKFDYRPAIVQDVKANLPGRRWDGKLGLWVVPIKSRNEVEAFKRRHGVTDVSAKQAAEVFGEIPELPELSVDITNTFRIQPFPYQAKGIARGLELKRFINGDQPGLGKSFQSLATVTLANAFPCLVICPTSLKENWRREWEKFAGKKADVLTDSVKGTWATFLKIGMVEVWITNYESLKKYFVRSINKPDKDSPLRLEHIRFREEEISLFKSVIIDEIHRCFPYYTKVLTNKGWFQIGDIVENQLDDLLVASVNPSDFKVSFKPINRLWKNATDSRRIYRIRHSKGWFDATEDHKVYTAAGRYKEVREIESGETLCLLREEFLNSEEWAINSQELLQKLCFQNSECETGSQVNDGQAQEKRTSIKTLRLLRNRLQAKSLRCRGAENKVLFPELFREVAYEATGNTGNIQNRRIEGKEKGSSCEANAESRVKEDAFRSHEAEQSHIKSNYCQKDIRSKQRKNIPFTRRKWKINQTSDITLRGSKPSSLSNGIANTHPGSKRDVSLLTTLLQGRYRHPSSKVGNRSRRKYAQSEALEISGQAQNRNIECVRVESCEVHQPEDRGELGSCPDRVSTVYDLEVADNHNYFAEGVLVSNCKDAGTQQAKFTKGVCRGKEYILGLTGTPIVNKPKDLIAQLGIIERLGEMGGYAGFLNRYCEGGTGAANLKELHWKLNTTCFFRREKTEVLKDLPAKMRQVVLCDITTRDEYKKAEKEFVNYLTTVKGCTDAEVRKKLRGEVMVKMGILKSISSRGKVNDVVEHITEVVESGEKIIVFCWLKEIMHQLIKLFPGCVHISGDVTSENRQVAVDRFQRDPNTQVIFLNIKAGGVGLTLTASSRVAFVEFPWTYADCEQCEDRAHRIGQVDSVQCTYFLGEGTIDRYCYDLIQAKKTIANTVTGTEDNVQEDVVDNLLNIFSKS